MATQVPGTSRRTGIGRVTISRALRSVDRALGVIFLIIGQLFDRLNARMPST